MSARLEPPRLGFTTNDGGASKKGGGGGGGGGGFACFDRESRKQWDENRPQIVVLLYGTKVLLVVANLAEQASWRKRARAAVVVVVVAVVVA
ncbi:hypothetical protein MY4824_002284 [Beauveria thailandica]